MNISDKSINRQLDYANGRGYEKVIIIGEKEIKNDIVTIKYLRSGRQEEKKITEL